ncbi:MAG: DsrE family protein [Pseudomonadota bacterium]
MIDSVCAIVTRPAGEEQAVLGLRLAYAAHMAGQETTLVCIEDGVYNLLPTPGYLGEMLAGFLDESGRVLADAASLAARGLALGDLVNGVEVAETYELGELLAEGPAACVF